MGPKKLRRELSDNAQILNDYLEAGAEAVKANAWNPHRRPISLAAATLGSYTGKPIRLSSASGSGVTRPGHLGATGAPIHRHHPTRMSDPYGEHMFTSQLPHVYKDARHIASGGTLFL